MARHARRLIFWAIGVLLSLAVLALLAVVLLLWGIDPDAYRGRIERAASDALGRRVELTGPLRWRPGLHFQVESRGGRIDNAAGFGATPFARWESLRFGVALRPLLDRRLVLDQVELGGLHLDLVRGAEGVNWNLPQSDPRADASGLELAIGSLRLRDSEIHYRDEPGGRTVALTRIAFDASLPADLQAQLLQFGAISLSAKLETPPLQAGGVELQAKAAHFEVEPATGRIAVPDWRLQWSDAIASGALEFAPGDMPVASGQLHLEAPSLRGLMRSASFDLPSTRDATVFGPLRFDARFDLRDGGAALTQLAIALDATQLTGEVRLATLSPLSVRFALAADQLDADRYRTPDNKASSPLELPLAELKALDARGSLTIRRATLAGAAAREMRIDVD